MKKYCTIITCAILSQTLPSKADLVFSNLGAGDGYSAGGRILQGETVGTIGNADQASTFTVGALSYSLTSLELGLGVSAAGPLDVILAADAGGSPGAALETISLNLNADGLAYAAASGSTVLGANTTYWVIADAKGSFDGAWRWNNTGDVGLTAGRSAPVNSFAYGPWNLRPDDDRYALRVEGNVVPEPTGSALLLLGFGLVRLVLGKKQRDTQARPDPSKCYAASR